MPNQQDIRRIAAAFCPETEPAGIRELTSGNVNATYRLDYDPQDRSRSLVLQRINTEAFRNPEALMEVSGIGEKKFAELRDYVTVGDENKGAES